MATKSGGDFVTDALREIQVISPVETPNPEQMADGLRCAADLLDTWRVDRLTIGGELISPYTLASGVQSYTIGPGGTFNQTYPARITRWSVVPDTTASDPVELPMGRPVLPDIWQQIRVKTWQSPYPTVLYFDDASAADLGHCLFYPVPNRSTVGVRIYSQVAALTALVQATDYVLRPGATRAFTLALALELADRYEKAATVTERLERRAAMALASFKRSNIRPKTSATRAEFAIGESMGRRTFNVYTNG